MTEQIVTRFAPSPTGRLHLGHAYSALAAWRLARSAGGRFLLRIEDIDQVRCRPEYEAGIYEDLDWLGLDWEAPVRRQSEHMDTYQESLQRLQDMGLAYPCYCTRKEINAEILASPGAPHGSLGPIYPGTCRKLSTGEREQMAQQGLAFAIRIDSESSIQRLQKSENWPIFWSEQKTVKVEAQPQIHGDFVIARKDIPTSYHLAVTIDDNLQGVTDIVRGQDLADSTHAHRLLQALLGLDTPHYHHHRLLTGNDGQRLTKRDQSQTIASLREAGHGREDLLKRLADI